MGCSKDALLQDVMLALLTELAGSPSSAVRGEVVRLLQSLVCIAVALSPAHRC